MTSPAPVRRRAVFLDVDGTLMQDGHHIPPSAIDAIRTARARGHLVLLSTGRGMAELRGDVMDIGFDGAVTNGGAYASTGDEIVMARMLSADDVAHRRRAARAHLTRSPRVHPAPREWNT